MVMIARMKMRRWIIAILIALSCVTLTDGKSDPKVQESEELWWPCWAADYECQEND